MLKKMYGALLLRLGKAYVVDDAIPGRLLLSSLFGRLVMLSRGLLKARRKVFLGRRVEIKNPSQFVSGFGCTLGDQVVLDCYGHQGVRLGNSVNIGAGSIVSVTSHMSSYGKGLEVGNNTGIGEYSYFGCSGGVKIGSDVIMGQYVSFHSQNHNFGDVDKLIREQGVTSKGIELGDDIWVGAKVTFLDGARVGDGCVVAAGSVVRGVFPEGVVLAGIPARVVKVISA